MRGLLAVLSALAVIALAYWAYRENFRTQQALSEVRALEREIAGLREALGVQHAEWAYLNRPARLRDLVDLNYDRLELLAMRPDQFGLVEQIAYPDPDLPEIDGTVELSAPPDPARSQPEPEASR